MTDGGQPSTTASLAELWARDRTAAEEALRPFTRSPRLLTKARITDVICPRNHRLVRVVRAPDVGPVYIVQHHHEANVWAETHESPAAIRHIRRHPVGMLNAIRDNPEQFPSEFAYLYPSCDCRVTWSVSLHWLFDYVHASPKGRVVTEGGHAARDRRTRD